MLATIKQEVNQIGYKTQELAKDYDREKGTTAVTTALAILNTQIFCIQKNRKVLVRHEDGTLKFHPENIPELFTEPLSVIVPVDFMAKHFKEHWAGFTFYSRNKIQEIRADLSARFKLFTLEERDWSDPVNRHRTPNPCESFNLIGALLLARALEDILLTHRKLEAKQLDWSESIGNGNYPKIRDEDNCALPAHKAYSTVALYNVIFDGIDSWGRDEADFSGQEPRPEVIRAIELEAKILQAEQAFETVLDADPIRDPEMVFITETFDYVKSEIIEDESVDCRIEVSNVVSTHPFCEFVRLTMKVSPKIRTLCQKRENAVNIPAWAFSQGERALKWWQRRIDESGLWFSEMTPGWVLDKMVPF